jgi:hypothetical protein
LEYTVKFTRDDLAKILEKGEHVPITITGDLNLAIHFKGITFITVK